MAGRRALFVFGAGTDVGKSVLSAALARSAANLLGAAHVRYIKPVQTGGAEIDAESTRSAAGVAVATETLFAWKTPVSPHMAVALEGSPVGDAELAVALRDTLRKTEGDASGLDIVETAGGVLSPAPSGTPQADVYKELDAKRVLLVGDGKLGGISGTLTSYESLVQRGFDVRGIAIVEDDAYVRSLDLGDVDAADLGNAEAVRSILRSAGAPTVLGLPPLPPMPEPLDAWLDATSGDVDGLLRDLMR